jgi:hypothetical protein
MSCRDIRLGFSEALDAPADSAARRRVEQHCAECAICGPEWRTLLRLEEALYAAAPPPPGFVDRVMASLPAAAPARREAMPFVAAGLIAAGVLLAFQLATVSQAAAPALDHAKEAWRGIADTVRDRAEETEKSWSWGRNN